MTQLSKVINGETYNVGYKYDAGGDVTQITYPSGRVVQYAYNNVGQLCEIAATASGCSDSTYYAGNYQYNDGNLTGFNYGNGVTAAFSYSPTRSQLTQLTYAKGNSSPFFNLQYWYQQNSPNCPNGTTKNNGSIQCVTDSIDSGRNANYTYDLLGRMISAQTAGDSAYPQWGLAETYDRYGNRLSQTVTAGSGPQTSMAFNNNNQPIGYSYDASGNMTVEPLSPPNQYRYDSENRISGAEGSGYSYDGNGLRVFRAAYSVGIYRASVYSGSQVIAEYDNDNEDPSTPAVEYIYNPANGGLLAMIANGTTTYYHQDDKSVRLTTDASGNVLTQQGTYPFGEPWYSSSNLGPGDNWVFTSYDRDEESGLDYALARYYDSRTGTFCSADPLAGSADDPQSWNRYAYGRNDPIDVTDPSGKSWWSSLLIDIGIGVGVALLPELAPSLFGATATADGSLMLYPGAVAGPITASGTAANGMAMFTMAVDNPATQFSWSTSIGMGLTAGGMAAAANTPKTPQTPTTPQTPKKNCPPVPAHPKGTDVDANIRATQATFNADPTGNGAKAWWVNQVKTNGAWDYKTQGIQYDDFGNFNYGATGAVFGFSSGTLEAGAVGARLLKSPLSQLKNYGLANAAHKNDMIRQGMQYKQNDCGKF